MHVDTMAFIRLFNTKINKQTDYSFVFLNTNVTHVIKLEGSTYYISVYLTIVSTLKQSSLS